MLSGIPRCSGWGGTAGGTGARGGGDSGGRARTDSSVVDEVREPRGSIHADLDEVHARAQRWAVAAGEQAGRPHLALVAPLVEAPAGARSRGEARREVVHASGLDLDAGQFASRDQHQIDFAAGGANPAPDQAHAAARQPARGEGLAGASQLGPVGSRVPQEVAGPPAQPEGAQGAG